MSHASLNPVIVAVPGDLHFSEPELENVRVAQDVVNEINTLVRPEFVQFIGDNAQDATEAQFLMFDDLRNRLNVPHFALVGDHDVKGDPAARGFRQHVGEPYGASSFGGFRFIRLNTLESRPLGLSAQQISWFAAEVDAAISRGERVVVFQHHYPFQIWESFDGPGIDDWRMIVQTRRIEAIVCGHTHYWQVANDGRNVAIAVRSIGDPEGGGPGFAVLYCDGDDLAATYRAINDTGPLVMITHPREKLLATRPTYVVSGDDRVIVFTRSASPVREVKFRIDDGPWSTMSALDEAHWSGPLPVDRVAKGEHTIDALACCEDGTSNRQSIEFMVDPTGRFTAVPAARPIVTVTAFC